MERLQMKLKEAWNHISLVTYVLVVTFGIGAWVAINGLWVELPLIVQHIPESWSLPSYLAVIIQLANIGPLAFVLGNKFYPRVIREVPVIYCIVLVGVLSCSLLAFLWKETAFIAGAQRSVALLSLAFFLSVVDCTSSVAFIPYMSIFPQVYLSPYFMGEGLSGLLPSLVALAQGVGEGASDARCEPSPESNATSQNWGPGPKFAPEVFFWVLCGMMVACGAAFLGLNFLPASRRQQVQNTSYTLSNVSHDCELQELQNIVTQSNTSVNNSITQSNTNLNNQTGLSLQNNIFLLVVLAIINGLSNGIIPAIQSYACIPYSYYIYHLTLTLSNIANPVTCLMFPLLRVKSIPVITVLSIIYCGMCSYILVVASQSPSVILRCGNAGAVLIVFISVSAVAVVTYCKVAISVLMRDQGRKKLIWFGVSTQVGSCIGALSIFAPVNVYHMFKQQ